jgi:hypothetical protein
MYVMLLYTIYIIRYENIDKLRIKLAFCKKYFQKNKNILENYEVAFLKLDLQKFIFINFPI